ncbi:hypothetical protein [Streptomyces sp. NPDC090025]|uniref:hypothetical protein n=1 Tax=Streptomyces sp. NPDC090025 TaxID=3365922 RepID=UPI003835A9AC
MWWTVLYIAFGVVALWLLGEVLLQYKARLRWRLLAFSGFLGVVIGVLMPSVVVIVIGAVTFAVGQTYVTLSFRRGFSTGWAIGGRPGASRRRRGGGAADPAKAGPTLEVSDLSYEPEDGDVDAHPGSHADGHPEHGGHGPGAAGNAVYEPEPMPEDTGQYGVYGYEQQPQHQGHQDQHPEQQPYADPYATGYDHQHAAAYDYGTGGQPSYAAYSDPYIGQQYGDNQHYDAYPQQQPYADPYAPSYTYDTPPGGVWVPQQRDTEQPYQDQHGQSGQQGQYGYGEDQQQYRY